MIKCPTIEVLELDLEEAKRLRWAEARQHTPEQLQLAQTVLEDIRSGVSVLDGIRKHPLPHGGYLGKHVLVEAYHRLTRSGEWQPDESLLARIRLKPVRTLSGVSTVTVLTKPYPCPNDCLFCPNDEAMPKSYIVDEPGAKRAYEHAFDPFGQASSRLAALDAVGHPTDKVELLILGGTWTAYPPEYQDWFLRRCFDALNGREGEVSCANLDEALHFNETAQHRNVGLVIETRPDHITPAALVRLRRQGVTKVQMGAQSTDDRILALNRRGHTYAQTEQAVNLLRAGGFKIVLHWMPNLLGATPQSDRQDFQRLWENLCPDEIKIYPTQLLESAALYDIWRRGSYEPYTTETLIQLIADIKPSIPRYCRVNRVVRDIPSNYVVAGNRRTSLRQDVFEEMKRRGSRCQCIRCREVKGNRIVPEDLTLSDLIYRAGDSEEHFLSFSTPQDQLAGFLRLSLPGKDAPQTGMPELDGAAIIREVHVYGQSLAVGEERNGAAQHIGLGSRLMDAAQQISRSQAYRRMAVIAAVGTRRYYLERGFQRADLYLVKNLYE